MSHCAGGTAEGVRLTLWVWLCICISTVAVVTVAVAVDIATCTRVSIGIGNMVSVRSRRLCTQRWYLAEALGVTHA